MRAANCIDIPDGFFQKKERSTDLNQAEDISPVRFFASFGPLNYTANVAGKRKERNMDWLTQLKKTPILALLIVLALVVFAALIVKCRCAPPVKGDRSVQLDERRQRPVTNDPALMGDFPKNGWQVTEGNRTSPPQLPPG